MSADRTKRSGVTGVRAESFDRDHDHNHEQEQE